MVIFKHTYLGLSSYSHVNIVSISNCTKAVKYAKIKLNMTAKTPRSRKSKGSGYEREIAKLYVEFGIDPNCQRMPLSGASEHLKGDIHKAHNTALEYRFVDEVKRQENLAIPQWWRQAVSQCTIGEEPLLHFKQNNQEGLSVIRTRTLFSLMGKIVELYNQTETRGDIVIDNSREIKNALYQIRFIKDALRKIENSLNKGS